MVSITVALQRGGGAALWWGGIDFFLFKTFQILQIHENNNIYIKLISGISISI